ncbi:alpha/beta hydrolase [uncultured Cocleimonas sp.]|uniref:alpha/beta hydrolase n=1 Tax=uncultured Cocleimonas sp. TaxID=1051587 RepID=UPI002614B906|nr:alpha/beta hydrolase [uncultured Cocleimonas sp.]
MTKKTDHPFKSSNMPFSMKAFFSLTTYVFKIVGAISPTLAGKLALRLFMTPPKVIIPRREKAIRESAKLHFINIKDRQISVRSWGEGPTILLAHGWGGRSSQLMGFIEPLVAAGYRVVGFEIPGHGDSTGKHSNMLDGASIIAEVIKQEGPVEAIIAHSFGTGTTLLSIDKFGVKTPKVVLISTFSGVEFILEIFGDLFSLRQSTLDAMQQVALKKFAHEYHVGWDWNEISPLETIKSCDSELLLIHDDQDHEVPIEEVLPLHKSQPQAKKLITSGFGHRKILLNKEVIDTTVDFITQ